MSVMLSKTAALKVARDSHGPIFKKGHGHSFTAPWKTSDPDGPCVEVDHVSYWAARESRAKSVACMALEYMGYAEGDANALTYDQSGNARDILAQAVARKPLSR